MFLNKIFISFALLLTFNTQAQSEVVPNVVGERLGRAIFILEEAGYTVLHDGGENYEEKVETSSFQHNCPDGVFYPAITYFRKVEKMAPSAGTGLAKNQEITLTSFRTHEVDRVPDDCSQAI